MLINIHKAIALSPKVAAYHAETYPEDYTFMFNRCVNHGIEFDTETGKFVYEGKFGAVQTVWEQITHEKFLSEAERLSLVYGVFVDAVSGVLLGHHVDARFSILGITRPRTTRYLE